MTDPYRETYRETYTTIEEPPPCNPAWVLWGLRILFVVVTTAYLLDSCSTT